MFWIIVTLSLMAIALSVGGIYMLVTSRRRYNADKAKSRPSFEDFDKTELFLVSLYGYIMLTFAVGMIVILISLL